jgi:hypothetical protein
MFENWRGSDNVNGMIGGGREIIDIGRNKETVKWLKMKGKR